jgi:hypothetical protein
MQIHVCAHWRRAPRREKCKYTQYTNQSLLLQTCPILLPIFFYYFLLLGHKNVISAAASFFTPGASFLFCVCFIRTWGPRIFNQSEFFFIFPRLSGEKRRAEAALLFICVFSSLLHIYICVKSLFCIKRDTLLFADASELCRRCNMTLNWISVCLTCRLTDWLSDWVMAECLQSQSVHPK